MSDSEGRNYVMMFCMVLFFFKKKRKKKNSVRLTLDGREFGQNVNVINVTSVLYIYV